MEEQIIVLLLNAWKTQTNAVSEYFKKNADDKVSPEDFALDPKRNKLNLLIGSTNHTSYHLGQLNLLKN